ncbi:hypothetical protein EDD68_12824 [Melghiribacillus thermohalophilus]|uniref:Uncharacterized protein n=1 Tax=Melghiribacillus thermohalophilus TaxID=1324956 RepID=A0A4R3MSW1_9BACI|nr:DUF4357 domain-containing protein [Melghiribacillus thermohalophilus]TCT17576.1 hypothetical protein EDD68_12824 [Melghiribacillus thermohalophilus]
MPDDLTPTIETNPETGRTITVYELQGTELIQELVSNNYINLGDKLKMTYKPRGGDEHTFEAEVVNGGKLKIVNKTFTSCSYAAVYCYRKIGSSRETENGLRKWKLPNGKSLEAARGELLNKSEV